MRKITSAQFKAEVEHDPAWSSKLTEPVEIMYYCDMTGSKITYLSPFLHFTGKDERGSSASFQSCDFLKVAEGKFEGCVSFSCSSIEKIRDLSCGKDNNGGSAYFYKCKSLKIAEGEFPGFVGFSDSSIGKIGELSCGKDNDGDSAYFRGCKSLKIAEGKFEGYVSFYNSSIEKIRNLSCGKNDEGIRLNVEGCPNLKSIPFTFKPEGIEANSELIKDLTETRSFIQEKRAEIVEIEI